MIVAVAKDKLNEPHDVIHEIEVAVVPKVNLSVVSKKLLVVKVLAVPETLYQPSATPAWYKSPFKAYPAMLTVGALQVEPLVKTALE